MSKRALLIGMTTTFLFLLLSGATFAGSQPAIGTEAGNWEFKVNSPATKADLAAQNYQYDEKSLAVIGTEAGDWEFNFDDPETKADRVAKNYKYDRDSFAAMGTEAGNWEYNIKPSNKNAVEMVVKEGDNVDSGCKC